MAKSIGIDSYVYDWEQQDDNNKVVQIEQKGRNYYVYPADLEEAKKKAVVVLPNNIIFSRFISLPPVNQKRVPEIVLYEARQQIPFNLAEVLWSWEPVKPALPGEEIEVGLFAAKKDMADAYSRKSSVKYPRFTTKIHALNKLLKFPEEGEGRDFIVYMEKNSGCLLEVRNEDGSYWVRSFPVGDRTYQIALNGGLNDMRRGDFVARRNPAQIPMDPIERTIQEEAVVSDLLRPENERNNDILGNANSDEEMGILNVDELVHRDEYEVEPPRQNQGNRRQENREEPLNGRVERAQIKNRIFRDLIAEIQRSIGYYKAMTRDAQFGKGFVIGDNTSLGTLEEIAVKLRDGLQYPIDINCPVKPEYENLGFPRGSEVAVGAALMGLDGRSKYLVEKPGSFAMPTDFKSGARKVYRVLGTPLRIIGKALSTIGGEGIED